MGPDDIHPRVLRELAPFQTGNLSVLLPVGEGLISPGPGRDTGIPSPVGHALGAATSQGWGFPGPVSERCYRNHVLYIPLSVFFLLFSSFLCCNVKLPLPQRVSFAFFFQVFPSFHGWGLRDDGPVHRLDGRLRDPQLHKAPVIRSPVPLLH